MSDKFVADYILDGHFCLYTRKKLIVVCCLMTVLWRCWLGVRKGIQPVKTEWWGAGVVICLERGVDLHMTQLMPLPLTVSCFSKIQIGFTFLVSAHPGSPGKRVVKWVCVSHDRWMMTVHCLPMLKVHCSGPTQMHVARTLRLAATSHTSVGQPKSISTYRYVVPKSLIVI